MLICNALSKRESRYLLRFQYAPNGEVAAIAATAAIVAQCGDLETTPGRSVAIGSVSSVTLRYMAIDAQGNLANPRWVETFWRGPRVDSAFEAVR